VVQIDASGIYGNLSLVNSTAATLNNQSNGMYVEVTPTAGSPNTETQPIDLETAVVDDGVIMDDQNNTLFLVMDSSMLEKKQYEAEFVIDSNHSLVEEDPDTFTMEEESVSTQFTVVDREAMIQMDGDQLAMAQSEDAMLSASTTLAPGSEVRVRLQSTDNQNPFLKDETFTVEATDSGPMVSAAFDLSDVAVGTNFTAKVRDSTTGNIVSEEVNGQVAASTGDGDGDGDNTTTTTTTTTTEDTTTTTTTTEETTTTTTTTTEDPMTDDSDTTTENDGTPGFGIAVALVALLAAGALALRREQ
jgi:PGF-CTERM protein